MSFMSWFTKKKNKPTITPDMGELVVSMITPKLMHLHCVATKSRMQAVKLVIETFVERELDQIITLQNIQYKLIAKDVKRVALTKVIDKSTSNHISYYRLDVIRTSPKDSNLVEMIHIVPHLLKTIGVIDKGFIIDMGGLIPDSWSFHLVKDIYFSLSAESSKVIQKEIPNNIVQFIKPKGGDRQ